MESKDYSRVYNLFNTIEMPLVTVIAELEMRGMVIDQDYAKRLSLKYHRKLDDIDKELYAELERCSQ